MKKYIKYVVILVILAVVVVLGFLIYKNLFKGSSTNRYENIEKYELTKKEISTAKNKIKELEGIKSVDIYTNSKNIIKIVVVLEKDIEFKLIQEKADSVLDSFSEKNLSYYDVEFFVDYLEADNQIGYKFKTNSKFSW